MKAKVFIGVPSYDGRINSGILSAHLLASKCGAAEFLSIESGSWLTKNFNGLLAQALNLRAERGLTHFCLMHDDIAVGQPGWLDKMLEIMEANGADVLSAIVPIKNGSGITSTALDEVVNNHVRRLTLHEAFNEFPATFTHDKLLLNTGLMLIDLRKPWVEEIWFQFLDSILRVSDGAKVTFKAVGCPEDWDFSRRARCMGAKLFATREIAVTHLGNGKFSNAGPFGTEKTDK